MNALRPPAVADDRGGLEFLQYPCPDDDSAPAEASIGLSVALPVEVAGSSVRRRDEQQQKARAHQDAAPRSSPSVRKFHRRIVELNGRR